VFVIAGSPRTFSQRAMIACSSVQAAVASHETATILDGFEPAPPQRIVVSVPHEGSRRAYADYVHRSSYLPDRHIKYIGAIPTTTTVRTIIDMAGVSLRHRVAEMIDWAISEKRVTVPELVDEFNATARQGRKGSKLLRPLIVERLDGNAIPATVLERAMTELIASAGLEMPISQWSPPWGASLIGRVDFAYLDHRLVVEVDGRRWHTRVNDFEVDSRRRQLAAMAGWQTLGFTWKQVTKDPDGTIETLRETLASQMSLISGRTVP